MTTALIVHYSLAADNLAHAQERAVAIAHEQTAELSPEVIRMVAPDTALRGEVLSVDAAAEDYTARIAFGLDCLGPDLAQLLNVLFGNISLQDGILIHHIDWPEALLHTHGGPLLGIEGMRDLVGVHNRPLLCAATKPMGLDSASLANACAAFAEGGMDLIKDDHGLGNQPTARTLERLTRCVDAVAESNARTGHNTLYLPHISADRRRMEAQAEAAKRAGCRMVLVNPGLVGLDAMSWIRDDYGLGVMAHPAMVGGLMRAKHGFTPPVLLGDLFRLAGADAVIFPNTGGRFPRFDADTVADINQHLRNPMGSLKPAFPTLGGGVNVARARHWMDHYGNDIVLLIGGSLYAQGDLVGASRRLREALESQA